MESCTEKSSLKIPVTASSTNGLLAATSAKLFPIPMTSPEIAYFNSSFKSRSVA